MPYALIIMSILQFAIDNGPKAKDLVDRWKNGEQPISDDQAANIIEGVQQGSESVNAAWEAV